MKVVKATEGDLEGVMLLSNSTLKSFHSLDFFKKRLDDFFYVLKDGEKNVGFIIVKSGTLVLISVDKDYRRQGLGKMMVDLALREFSELRLKVRGSNTTALKFYKDTDWELIEWHKEGYKNGDEGFIFRKKA